MAINNLFARLDKKHPSDADLNLLERLEMIKRILIDYKDILKK